MSQVDRFLLYFDLPLVEFSERATAVHEGFAPWRNRFLDAFELLTKQRRSPRFRVIRKIDDLDLFCWGEDKKQQRPYKPSISHIELTGITDDVTIHCSQFRRACEIASEGKPLSLAYRTQLEAYRALGADDFRKAIIETAVSAEIALTEAIRGAFKASGVDYGDKLMGRFRMLGGRLDLARILQLPMPPIDLQKVLVDPRNDVIHRAEFVDAQKARGAVNATDKLLSLLIPPI